MVLRAMKIEDYEEVFQLWESIKGFSIRSVDDSFQGIEKFLIRNPDLSVVAVNENGQIIGTILCGHDGRRGGFYHVCVKEEYRHLGIGHKMVEVCTKNLQKEGINKINLIAFTKNKVGNAFWKMLHWKSRSDVNYYEQNLNEANTTYMVE